MIIKRFALLMIHLITLNASAMTDDKYGAFYIKDSIMAAFPLMKDKNKWIWYKKERPEYAWVAETGFYENGKFRGNGFGFMASIGSANLENTPRREGSLDELIEFAGKNAFLTNESPFYKIKSINNSIMYSSRISAKVIAGELIMLGTQNSEAVEISKFQNPTHMRLQAILPEGDESYVCYPKLERISP